MSLSIYKIKWATEITHNLDLLKFNSERALSLLEFFRDFPRAVRVIKDPRVALASRIALLPIEIFLTAIRDVGAFFEFILASRPLLTNTIKKEKHLSKKIGMVTYALFTGIDTFFLIPQRWNLIDMGRWSATLGRWTGIQKMPSASSLFAGLSLLKDIFIAITISLDLYNAKREIQKNSALILNKRAKLAADAPLTQLKSQLTKLPNESDLQAIEKLKLKYRPTKYNQENINIINKRIEKLKIKQDLVIRTHAVSRSVPDCLKLKKLEAKINTYQEKLARIHIWQSKVEAKNLDQLKRLVIFKIEKNTVKLANVDTHQTKLKRERLFNISILASVILGNMLTFGAALAFSPLCMGLLFLGNWSMQLTSGLLGIYTLPAMVRQRHLLPLPETYFREGHLIKA